MYVWRVLLGRVNVCMCVCVLLGRVNVCMCVCVLLGCVNVCMCGVSFWVVLNLSAQV